MYSQQPLSHRLGNKVSGRVNGSPVGIDLYMEGDMSKIFISVIVLVLVVMIGGTCNAADKIPHYDFVKYAESCIDSADELEMLYSKYSISINTAIDLQDKIRFCVKKFERYGDRREWDKSLQTEFIDFVYTIIFLSSCVNIAIEAGNESARLINNVKSENDKMKSVLIKYKENSQGKFPRHPCVQRW